MEVSTTISFNHPSQGRAHARPFTLRVINALHRMENKEETAYTLSMSQFRKDPVSGEWMLIAPERSHRPHTFKKTVRKAQPKAKCPFENLEANGNWPPLLIQGKGKAWRAVLVPNKYPALRHALNCPVEMVQGPYRLTDGVGYHELVITRDHQKDFPLLSSPHAIEVFKLFRERYRTIDEDGCMVYLSIFGNWGPSAGASVAHPHYQLIALPVLPPSIARSYAGSEAYFKKTKHCIHCDLIAAEKKDATRIIAENSEAIAFAPFVSRMPYEVKIFPKRHTPGFRDATDASLAGAAVLLQKVLRSMKKKLGDPDYNFYMHSSPLKDSRRYDHYHWHIEVVPKLGTPAGFELSTGLIINDVDPEQTAKLLR